MTTTPKNLADAARQLAKRADSGISETRTELSFEGRFDDAREHEAWRGLLRCLGDLGLSLRVRDEYDEAVDLLSASYERVDGRTLLFRFDKSPVDGIATFFTTEGLGHFVDDAEALGAVSLVAVASGIVPFSTFAADFVLWDGPLVVRERTERLAWDAPRRFVRDLAHSLVPSRASPWLLASNQPTESEALAVWRTAAARRLPFVLVNEAWRDNDQTWVALKAERTVTLALGAQECLGAAEFLALTEAVQWVFGDRTDAEIRHTLLSYELCREWVGDAPFLQDLAARLPSARSGAEAAYRNHVRETSRDTLKSLADLRKALNEEAEKVSGQTRDLTSGLWRDFAVGAAAVVARFTSMLGNTGTTPKPISAVLIGTGIFLAFSFTMTVFLNHRFHRHAKEARSNWHAKLYGFLKPEEFDELCTAPMKRIRGTYRTARRGVGLAYAVLVVILLGLGFHGLLAKNGQTIPDVANLAATPASQTVAAGEEERP